MTDQVTRIGRGVPTPPPPEPRRKASSWIVAAAVVFAVAVFGTVALLTNPPAQQAAAPAQTTAATVDAKGVCMVLVPVLATSTDIIAGLAANTDGSTVNWKTLEQTIADLQAVRPLAPVELRDDIQYQIDPLVELKQRHDGVWAGSATMDMTDYRASGLRLSAWCGQYAS